MKQQNGFRGGWLLFPLLLIVLALVFMPGRKQNELSYQQFKQVLESGDVGSLIIYQNEQTPTGEVRLANHAGEVYVTYVSDVNQTQQMLQDMDIDYSMNDVPQTSYWMSIILPVAVSVGAVVLMLIIMNMRAGAGGGTNAKMMNFGKSRAKMTLGDKSVTFAQVAGLKEEKEELEEIVDFLKEPGKYTGVGARIPKGVLLEGPPGTGKTYNVVRYAVELIEGKKILPGENYDDVKARYEKYVGSGQIKFTTFHQSFSYEEFVEGIRPIVVDRYGNETNTAHSDTTVIYRAFNGVFKSLCEKAAKSPHMNFVCVIDEINRGNISRIFGELITLIEESKRGTSVILPYSQAEFSVPVNLYILGTMNTADRSIAMFDTALRRRFDFIEMMPDPNLLGECDGVDLRELFSAINERIEYYYDREHAVGHAYFMKRYGCIQTLDELRNVFGTKIIPLLQEYFFDDYEKIKLILNDENTFIECVSPKYIKRFDSGQKLYRLGNPSNWNREHFINIYR